MAGRETEAGRKMTDENFGDRAAFESWIKAPPLEQCISRHGPECAWSGQYKIYAVQLAWDAWQQAARFATKDAQ